MSVLSNMAATSHTLLLKFKLIKITNIRFLVSSHMSHIPNTPCPQTQNIRITADSSVLCSLELWWWRRTHACPLTSLLRARDRSPSEHWDLRCHVSLCEWEMLDADWVTLSPEQETNTPEVRMTELGVFFNIKLWRNITESFKNLISLSLESLNGFHFTS